MGYIYPNSTFQDAQTAFVMLFDKIGREGVESDAHGRTFPNFGFYLENPSKTEIQVPWYEFALPIGQGWAHGLKYIKTVKDLDTYLEFSGCVFSGFNFLLNDGKQTDLTVHIEGSSSLTGDFAHLQHVTYKLLELYCKEKSMKIGKVYLSFALLFLSFKDVGKDAAYHKAQGGKNFTCGDCKGVTYDSETCENANCPNMPCCGEYIDKCNC
jgi:hypothetical protein